MTSDEWVTIAEAVRLTGVSERTIWRVIAEYQLDTSKLRGERGHGIRYSTLTAALLKRHDRIERERHARNAA